MELPLAARIVTEWMQSLAQDAGSPSDTARGEYRIICGRGRRVVVHLSRRRRLMVSVLVYALVLGGGATLLHREAEHPSPAKGEARTGGNLASFSSRVDYVSVCLRRGSEGKTLRVRCNIAAASTSGCVCVVCVMFRCFAPRQG